MEKTIPIPEGITAEKKGAFLKVTGPKGSLQRAFSDPVIDWSIQDNAISIHSTNERRKTHALVGTVASHTRNMITGVEKGFEARLKAVYSHFPMKIKVEGSQLLIQNFMGERSSRIVEILEGVTVDVKKDDVIVSGINKEDVGQTAGRIEQVSKVTGFDRRVFQDGIHLVTKTRPKEERRDDD